MNSRLDIHYVVDGKAIRFNGSVVCNFANSIIANFLTNQSQNEAANDNIFSVDNFLTLLIQENWEISPNLYSNAVNNIASDYNSPYLNAASLTYMFMSYLKTKYLDINLGNLSIVEKFEDKFKISLGFIVSKLLEFKTNILADDDFLFQKYPDLVKIFYRKFFVKKISRIGKISVDEIKDHYKKDFLSEFVAFIDHTSANLDRFSEDVSLAVTVALRDFGVE